MGAGELIRELRVASRGFGKRAAVGKARLLDAVVALDRIGGRDLVALQDTLNFMRAYPDDPGIRRRVLALVGRLREWGAKLTEAGADGALHDRGFPGSAHSYSYSYGVLLEMVRALPGCLELDREAIDDEGSLMEALWLCVSGAESDGLQDERLTLRGWLERARPRGARTDLEQILGLLERSGHAEQVRVRLFEAGDLPVRFELREPGTGRSEVTLPVRRVRYQKADVERSRFPLAPLIREPLGAMRPLPAAQGRELIRASLVALCGRNLEIYPLIYASPRDVMRVTCGRGVEIVLAGVRPRFRAALETLYFFLVVKNGVPVAYGPAGAFLGACEMGINLFPEFRGGEIRFIYAQVMRVLRHLLGVEYYFVEPYGMGVGNPDAIRSGAFWFYRKLGFRAENPRVEALARDEERRMRHRRGYRSDTRMLHRLKHTRAYFDLGAGHRGRFDFAALGLRLSTYIGRRFDGDRDRAARACVRRVARTLKAAGVARWGDDARSAFAQLAPVLALIPDLEDWPAAEKAALVRAIRAKGASSEACAARMLARHLRFDAALRSLARFEG